MQGRIIKKRFCLPTILLCFAQTVAAQQLSFEDHMTTYPGIDESCSPGTVLTTSDGNFVALARCSESQITIVKYNAELQPVADFGTNGVVTFDSSVGISSAPESDAVTMSDVSEFIMVTDAKLGGSDTLWIAGFNYDIETPENTYAVYRHFQPWWLKLDSTGEPLPDSSGNYLHMQPNDLENFDNFGGGNWFSGLRSDGFLLPLEDGSVVSGSVVLDYDADPIRQNIQIEKRNPDNTVDATFAGGGSLTFVHNSFPQLNNVAFIVGLYPFDDEHFLLATSDFYSYRYGGFTLRKISHEGVVDTSFGVDGTIQSPGIVNIDQFNEDSISGSQRAMLSDVVLNEDWIYLAWQEDRNGDELDKTSVIARFTMDGQLDTDFAQNGLFRWSTGVESHRYLQIGNPYLVVLDGQIAVLNSDSYTGNTQLRLLTHEGDLNTEFANMGVLTGEWNSWNPFQFFVGHNFTPPLNLNKPIHLIPNMRQLAVPLQDRTGAGSNISIVNVFSNRKPMAGDQPFLFFRTDDGWTIDTRIVDLDNDNMTATIINAPDFVRVSSDSVVGSLRLFAETLEEQPQSFSVDLSVSDGINSPALISLDITTPSRAIESGNDVVHDDTGGTMSYLTLLLMLFTGRRRFGKSKP